MNDHDFARLGEAVAHRIVEQRAAGDPHREQFILEAAVAAFGLDDKQRELVREHAARALGLTLQPDRQRDAA